MVALTVTGSTSAGGAGRWVTDPMRGPGTKAPLLAVPGVGGER